MSANKENPTKKTTIGLNSAIFKETNSLQEVVLVLQKLGQDNYTTSFFSDVIAKHQRESELVTSLPLLLDIANFTSTKTEVFRRDIYKGSSGWNNSLLLLINNYVVAQPPIAILEDGKTLGHEATVVMRTSEQQRVRIYEADVLETWTPLKLKHAKAACPVVSNIEQATVVIYDQWKATLLQDWQESVMVRRDLSTVCNIAKQIALTLQEINNQQRVVSGLSLKSFARYLHSPVYEFVDFEHCVSVGTGNVSNLDSFTWSDLPPEVAEAKCEQVGFEILPETFNVWGFGIILFELLSGQPFFTMSSSTRTFISLDDKVRLVNWMGMDVEMLDQLPGFPLTENAKAEEIHSARQLVNSCLQRDPKKRGGWEEVLNHRFFDPESLSTAGLSTHTHFFLSHKQLEASDMAKDLFYLAKNFELTSWLDAKQRLINKEAMLKGVQSCRALLACVTHEYFFSGFCLLEFWQAIKKKKMIIMILEIDKKRAFFDVAEFVQKLSTEHNNIYMDLLTLNKDAAKDFYTEIIPQIFTALVEVSLPYRRRSYENKAMMKQIINLSGLRLPATLFGGGKKTVRPSDSSKTSRVTDTLEAKIKGIVTVLFHKQAPGAGSPQPKQEGSSIDFLVEHVPDGTLNGMKKSLVQIENQQSDAVPNYDEDLLEGINGSLDRWKDIQVLPFEKARDQLNSNCVVIAFIGPSFFGTEAVNDLKQAYESAATKPECLFLYCGFSDLKKETARFPNILDCFEFLPYRANDYEHRAMMKEISRRCRYRLAESVSFPEEAFQESPEVGDDIVLGTVGTV